MKELIKDLRSGFDADPSFAHKELARMEELCHRAANALEQYEIKEEQMNEDPYIVLSKINVGEHIEKKNGLSYLSWAWAWDTFIRIYPMSETTINRPENGMPYWTDGNTCWVDVSVILKYKNSTGYQDARKRSEVFPIMNYNNKSIPADKVTSFDVNTALQRAWTKCIARHGLGFYIYAGQDLPNDEAEEKKETEANKPICSEEDVAKIMSLYSDKEIGTMLKRMKLSNLCECTVEQAARMIAKRDQSLVKAEVETF